MAVISSEMRGAPRSRGVGNFLDHDAQQRAGDDGGAHGGDRAEAQLVHDEPGHVSAHHNDIAMGKVQQQDDAVHHAVAQCDQCIDAAQGKTVDQLTKKHCHGLIPSFLDPDRNNTKMRRRSKQTSTDGLRKWIIENFAAFRAAARSGLEHLFQNRRAIDIGQDRGALDGVVVLIKGKGTGDALDGAILDAIDHSLLVLIGACFQTSVLQQPECRSTG